MKTMLLLLLLLPLCFADPGEHKVDTKADHVGTNSDEETHSAHDKAGQKTLAALTNKIGHTHVDDREQPTAVLPPCFPGESLVVLNGGKNKSMEQLRIGDVVMTFENGKLEPTTVLGFLDKKKNATAPYLNLVTEDGKSLFISARHAMFIREDDVTRSVLAQDIKAGEKVIVNHRNGFRFAQVKTINIAAKTGAYVPLTSSGTLLVDGVLVSCYTNGDHWLAHRLATPLQWWPSFLLDTEESQDEEGIRTIPWLIREFATIMGLATRAEVKLGGICSSIFKMSQMTMTSIDKTEF